MRLAKGVEAVENESNCPFFGQASNIIGTYVGCHHIQIGGEEGR